MKEENYHKITVTVATEIDNFVNIELHRTDIDYNLMSSKELRYAEKVVEEQMDSCMQNGERVFVGSVSHRHHNKHHYHHSRMRHQHSHRSRSGRHYSQRRMPLPTSQNNQQSNVPDLTLTPAQPKTVILS